MSSLSYKIEEYLERTVNFNPVGGEVLLQNDSDGKGDYIKYWSDSIEKSKPTDEQLNAFVSEATKSENNNNIRATRKNLYGNIGDQLDEIFKDIDAWKTRIQKIKTDNPKE